jgi:serine/threonine protein kinase
MDNEIKRGAFGIIYKGFYEKNREPIAIKLDLNDPSTLKHEVRIIQHLSMAGVSKIPAIYWFGIHDTKPCVVMTLYECSLYDYRQRTIPTEEYLFKIMWLLLDIFENIHKNWVLHRDIKPHNFMIKNGEIFLIDFGLATFYIDDKGEHRQDEPNTQMIGSPYFASIHIHEGHRYTRRDDLISLGYVWLFMAGTSWKQTPNIENLGECSLLDLQHPNNIWLFQQKQQIFTFMTNPAIIRYMNYVYELEYNETPIYLPMKQLFL